MAQKTERRLSTGRGSWDEGREWVGGRGSCRAENGSEWRMAIGD